MASEDDFLVDIHRLVCEKCSGRMLYKGGGRFECEDCAHEYYNNFGKVKNFLEKHGPSNVVTICQATGLPRREVMSLLREGRIEVSPNSNVMLQCAICGVSIRYGMYCSNCESSVASGAARRLQKRSESKRDIRGTLNPFASDEGSGDSGKMRFVNRQTFDTNDI